MNAVVDVILIVLAVVGAFFGAGCLIATVAYFTIRGIRTPRVRDGDETDDIWT